MKNAIKVLGIIALVAVIGFSMVSCGNDDGGGGSGGSGGGGGGGGPQTATYIGKSGNDTYTLKITENTAKYAAQIGDTYELTVGSKKSTGTVSNVADGVLTLKPTNATTTFTATVSGNNIIGFTSSVTWDGESTPTSLPSTLTGGNQGGGGNNAHVVGTWKGNPDDGDYDIFVFTADYKYTLDKGSGKIDEEGTYTVSGNTVNMEEPTPAGIWKRTGTINGNAMTITVPGISGYYFIVYKQ